MNADEILDGEPKFENFASFEDCIGWWEKKRMYYNTFIAMTLVGLFIFAGDFSFSHVYPFIVFSFGFLILANIFFSVGWGLEVLSVFYGIKLIVFLIYMRPAFLVLGYLFSFFLAIPAYLSAMFLV